MGTNVVWFLDNDSRAHDNTSFIKDRAVKIYIHWKKKVEPKRLQGGTIFMSTGWPLFRYMIIKEKMAPLLKSGAILAPLFFQCLVWLIFNFSIAGPIMNPSEREVAQTSPQSDNYGKYLSISFITIQLKYVWLLLKIKAH